MGLDIFTFTTAENIPAADFAPPDDQRQIFYWRKHLNLHGWMEKLYRANGGSMSSTA